VLFWLRNLCAQFFPDATYGDLSGKELIGGEKKSKVIRWQKKIFSHKAYLSLVTLAVWYSRQNKNLICQNFLKIIL